jgi:hypothetical protein
MDLDVAVKTLELLDQRVLIIGHGYSRVVP